MSRVILLVLAAGAVAVFMLSPRGWSMTDIPRIEALAALPDTEKVGNVLSGLDTGIVLPYLPGEARARSESSTPAVLRIGILYREVSLMKMPFWAYRDGGLVAYRALPSGYSAAPVPPEQVAALEAAAGQVYSGRRFALWQHLWGWLFGLGFLSWWFVARREEARRDAGDAEIEGEAEPAR
jgi:hypothetical protein